MILPTDCMYCSMGVIKPHEIAQGHDRCGDCRTKVFKAHEEKQRVNDLGRANGRVRS